MGQRQSTDGLLETGGDVFQSARINVLTRYNINKSRFDEGWPNRITGDIYVEFLDLFYENPKHRHLLYRDILAEISWHIENSMMSKAVFYHLRKIRDAVLFYGLNRTKTESLVRMMQTSLNLWSIINIVTLERTLDNLAEGDCIMCFSKTPNVIPGNSEYIITSDNVVHWTYLCNSTKSRYTQCHQMPQDKYATLERLFYQLANKYNNNTPTIKDFNLYYWNEAREIEYDSHCSAVDRHAVIKEFGRNYLREYEDYYTSIKHILFTLKHHEDKQQ